MTHRLGTSKQLPRGNAVTHLEELQCRRCSSSHVRPLVLDEQGTMMVGETYERRGSGPMLAGSSLLEAQQVPCLSQMPLIDVKRNGAPNLRHKPFVVRDDPGIRNTRRA
jgi:hypothetical protein